MVFSAVQAAILVCAAQPGLMKSEFIFETAPFASSHASTIVESRNGLVAAWFGGTAERKPDVGIWISRMVSGKWSAPVEVANGIVSTTNRFPCWNPVLFQLKEGPLLLFYKVGPSPSRWWAMVMSSTDNGLNWSTARRLPEGFLGPIKNKPVQLPNGEILCGSSTEDEGWQVHFERTSAAVDHWEKTGPLNDGRKLRAIQPSILFHKGGRLQAVGRTEQEKIFETWSEDGGKTWSTMTLTSLPNPNSGLDAVTLNDGRQLLVYNHTAKHRSPLNVAVSSDGKHWLAALELENEPNAEFSYPAVIQSSDNLVHITYTWKRRRIEHVVLDPSKLELRELVDGKWPNEK
jgi:predicted neuraminidase